MSLALAAGTVSSVIFAASNLPMLVKARRTRDLSSYSLAYLVLNNVGNVLYCLYVYDLPPGPIWAMQSFYLLSMALLLRWYLRFTPRTRARRAQPRYSGADAQPAEVSRPVVVFAASANRGRPLAMGSGPSLPVNLGRLHAVCRIRGRGIDTHVTRPSWTGSLGEGQPRPAATKPKPRRAHAHSRPIRIHGHRRRSQQDTWETFSRNWHVDVQHVFNWPREALLRPLLPGSTVIAFSSGAAVAGSPLSGGCAGVKAAIRFIAAYAATESERADLGIKFTAVLPQLTPATDLGAAGVAAYAARQGLDLATALERFGPALTPEQVGTAVLELATDPNLDHTAYLLTTTGLAAVS